MPPPGDDRQLAETVARIFARPLDRSRPLWELYLIHGLPDGRVAMLTKLHHSMVDGVSGNEILGVLLDPSPEGKELPPKPAGAPGERVPGDLEMLGRGLLGVPRQPLRALRSLPSALPNLTELPGANALPGRAARCAGALLAAPRRRRPERARGHDRARRRRRASTAASAPHRRFAFGSLSLDTRQARSRTSSGSRSTTSSSRCAPSAVRDWLLERDELPDEPLVAMVPVSVRTEEQAGTFGNRISTMIVPIPTNVADPRERLHARPRVPAQAPRSATARCRPTC